ncbi:hypothetical protein PR202_ga06845 [Eleusine coracana subsp. coracana]|uniref:DUF4220 domain-containing protein n=1 Tax=Eleusine coracana subsp. coracana TaxID=191504 RepID=A0AAV5BVW9_ELECO|nr:hypothetical protein PR202_ga06845 [Eleusine coracana subsp. coracana]
MASWLSRTTQGWGEWGLRITVLSSVTAHVALVLLAGTRRHHVSLLGKLLLWPAYQAVGTAGYALGKLSLSGTSPLSPSREQQLVAFWAPFLLLHLGCPDNISAYALEDNKLCRVADLLPASILMFVVGAAKYIERAFALWRGDLGNIRGSSTEDEQQRSRQRVDSLTVRRWVLDNEQALLLAHGLFNFCRHAMVGDSSVQEDHADSQATTSERIFSLEWSSMCKVVEMELSLMYDVIYTEATVIHTWGGYLIRLLSPVASATAASLFWGLEKDYFMTIDIIITYILLAVAMVLDVVWLVRTFGSTWAYAFLDARPRTWLYHVVLCSGRWRWLRCIIISLDPSNLILRQDPGSYRRWSAKIGRYNLLDECTRVRAGSKTGLWSRLLAKVESVESRYVIDDARDRPRFGREFQEDILVWHIGTSIFLACANQQLTTPVDYGKYVKAIEVLSEYLMFLLAMRRHMLSGLVLSSLFEVTRDALGELWIKTKSDEKCYSSSSRARKVKLAEILHKEKYYDSCLYWGNKRERLISDGAELAILLLDVGKSNMQKFLELFFDAWVDKLLYAATRCSRESHTKQLSRGGELATIVWIMTEHADPFQIGEFIIGEVNLEAPPLSEGKQSGEKKDGAAEKETEPPKKEEHKPSPHEEEPWSPPPKAKWSPSHEEEPWSPPPKAKRPEDKKPKEKKPEKPHMEKMKPASPPLKP